MGKYLLVAEGPTDHVVIREIAESLSVSHNKKIEIIEMAPRADATSGSYPAFGWSAIEKWCKRYKTRTPAEIAAAPAHIRPSLMRNNWRALLAIDNADGLIIQIDNDIAHEISNPHPFILGSNRTHHCHNSILMWLGETTLPSDLYLAVSSMSTETWILAAFEPTEPVFADLAAPFNYENIEDCEDRLLKLGLRGKNKNGRKRLLKTPYTTYEPYAKLIVQKITAVRQRCSALDQLCAHISK